MTFIYMIDLQFPEMVFVQPDFKFCLFFQLTLSVFCINNLVPGWGSDERKGELLPPVIWSKMSDWTCKIVLLHGKLVWGGC